MRFKSGYDPKEWDQFKNALDIIHSQQLSGMIIPMPTPEDDQDIFSYHLDTSDRYRLSEVHRLILQKRFDLARPHGILTAAYKAHNKGSTILTGLDKYSQIIQDLSQTADSQYEYDSMVISNAADKCAYLKYSSKRGCNLCQQDKSTPLYPYELIWYTSHTARSLFLRSISSKLSSLSTKGSTLLLLDKYCLYDFLRIFLNPNPVSPSVNSSLEVRSLGIWHSIFDIDW